MKLSEKQANFCIYEAKKYPLNLEFSNVLRAYEILEDPVLLPFEKTQFFIYSICPKAYKIKLDKILDFAEFVVKNFINDNSKPSFTAEKTVDMTQDANYIYASFKQAFDIDLYKNKISWRSLWRCSRVCQRTQKSVK